MFWISVISVANFPFLSLIFSIWVFLFWLICLRVCQLHLYCQRTNSALLILCIILLISILLISALIFIISFLLVLGLAYSCFLRTWDGSLVYLRFLWFFDVGAHNYKFLSHNCLCCSLQILMCSIFVFIWL
jgi:hypothetical protein